MRRRAERAPAGGVDPAGKPTLAKRLRSIPATTGRVAMALWRDIAPKIAFFFAAFMFLFLLFKLFVAQYAIEYSAFAKAAVAALVLGKVIPLLDWADSGYRFEGQRRIVVIGGKTLVYALVVVLLGIGERVFTAYRREGSVTAAIGYVTATADAHRFLGLVLLLSLVVGTYLTMQEIDRAMGKGTVVGFLLERPADRRG